MNCLRFRHHHLLGIVAVILALGAARINAAASNQRVYTPLVMLAAASEPPSPPSSLLSTEEQEVLNLTNQLRAVIGCGALAANPHLQTAAKSYSQYMIDTNSWGHTGLNGSTPASRAADAGYDGGVGENIAMGYTTAAEVYNAWLTSKAGHYENLVNCSYRDIGIGLVRSADGTAYWTQDFGIPR